MPNDPEFTTKIVLSNTVRIAGDSIYQTMTARTVFDCKIKRLDIQCIYEESENIWHVKVCVWHDHGWAEIYTDTGFKKEVSDLVFGIILPPEEFFEKKINGSMEDYRLEYTTSADQRNLCAILEPAEQHVARDIAHWVKKKIAEDELNRVQC